LPTQLRLLLIEDSPDDSELLLQHLKKSNISAEVKRVETISGLKEALQQSSWDMIICDYNLPTLNALDAISIIRENKPDVPCIVVSGSVGEEKAVETMKAGASDYILKDNLARLVPVLQRELREAEVNKEKKLIEANLKKSEEDLRQAQKLESIGQLAGGIAHDFNNLLATILLQSEVLVEALDSKLPILQVIQQVEKGTEQIIKTTERATNLTRQLLAFSRKQVVQPKVLSLNSLIIDMEKMLRRIIEESIEFKTDLAPDLKNLKMDPGHLEQIIMNLIVNCRDAMPKGGKLKIETKNGYLDGPTAKSCNVQPGPRILLTISDTGMGMSEEVKKHLFEPFFTTKPVGKGTGLGLCTVYGIVKQNKGLIFIESELGKGTLFKLFLPPTEDAVQTLVPVKQVETMKGTETILVVEDEEDLKELICSTLTNNGYKILMASTGLEALEQIKALKKPVDLVITDVVMPQMGGPELARQALLLNKNIKFLFQSGYAREALTQDGMPENQIYFLAKPYPLKDLLNKIRGILG
jgi:two-component system, cell cycle sensor histidine kinase and response regulator CckA